jgi:hypothetical protein
MCPRQRKAGRAVVEGRRLPHCCGMTPRAIMTEDPGDVIRVCRPIEICCMALVAVGIHQLVVAVGMARLAGA